MAQGAGLDNYYTHLCQIERELIVTHSHTVLEQFLASIKAKYADKLKAKKYLRSVVEESKEPDYYSLPQISDLMYIGAKEKEDPSEIAEYVKQVFSE